VAIELLQRLALHLQLHLRVLLEHLRVTLMESTAFVRPPTNDASLSDQSGKVDELL
jgi:hypothetical protein